MVLFECTHIKIDDWLINWFKGNSSAPVIFNYEHKTNETDLKCKLLMA